MSGIRPSARIVSARAISSCAPCGKSSKSFRAPLIQLMDASYAAYMGYVVIFDNIRQARSAISQPRRRGIPLDPGIHGREPDGGPAEELV